MSRSLRELAKHAADLAGQVDDQRLLPNFRLLGQRIHRPDAFVSVVGETSTGKSTLINALLGAPLLPAAAGPSTGTVTQVICRQLSGDRMLAVNRDGTQAELDDITFRALSQRPPAHLLRLQLHTDRAGPGRRGFNIIDTPGYNAVVAEHEEVLRAFLPESDAIVFVAGYRTGFGQADQDLYEVAREAASDDPDMPMVLAVNRAPAAATLLDKRVVEIASNARDSLHRDVEVLLIRSAAPAEPGAPPPLPDVAGLWDVVFRAAQSDERRERVQRKLARALAELCLDLQLGIATRLDADAASADDVALQLEALREGRERSLVAVKSCVARLSVTLPAIVRREAGRVGVEIGKLIDGSEKWLGQPDCTAYVVEHALPFEGRKACETVGDAIAMELERLDRELEEIANTTIRNLRERIRPANDAASRMASDLVRILAKRASGAVSTNLLRSFGGVGGVAAGAGNLVKTLLRRAGDLIGTKFSRGVYEQIGRIFNKRMVTRLGMAASVAIDVIFYVWDAHHWRGQLKERVGAALQDWEKAVVEDLTTCHLPQIEAANVEGVHACYDDMIEHAETGAAGLDEATRHNLRTVAAHLERILDDLHHLTAEA
jgi:hypothetical protein